jgi:nucleoside-diphosphate-sugar epimerase
MGAPMLPCFIITGASGALGTQLLPSLLARYPASSIFALVRSPWAAEQALQALPSAQRGNVQLVLADLASEDAVKQAAGQLPSLASAVGIHLAADVSWDKSVEELAPLNVQGTQRFADLLERTVERPGLVYVSTAFTCTDGWIYRNGYEETKATAQRLLAAGFGSRHPWMTYSCSLVVGSSEDGRISRYHGIYPLLRFLARFNPPFLVGNKHGRFDLIPADWAVEQLLHAIDLLLSGQAPQEVVAASGDDCVTFERLVSLAAERISRVNEAASLSAISPPPILKQRQWKFLKRSMNTWRPDGLNERDFRYFERLLEVYGQYAENDMSRPPLNVSRPAPSPESYLPVVLDYWLAMQHRKVAASMGVLA